MAISYRDTVAGFRPEHLEGGFFVGWPHHPDPATHLNLLQRSQHIWVAVDETSAQVVGFITAVGDGILSAYIPLLEVLEAYQGCGIGHELVSRMLATLGDLYMVDLTCDAHLVPFYESFGFHSGIAMRRRVYASQRGEEVSPG